MLAALWFQKRAKKSLVFFQALETYKSHDIEFYHFNWDNKDPNKFLDTRGSDRIFNWQVPELCIF